MAFIYDLTDTWNAGGTTFNAIKMNVTDTASAAASRLVSLQVGGVERFGVRKNGQGYFAGNVGIGTTTPSNTLSVAGTLGVTSDATVSGMLTLDNQLVGSGYGLNLPCQGGGSIGMRSDDFSGVSQNIRFRQSTTGTANIHWIFSQLDSEDRALAINCSSGAAAIKTSTNLLFQTGSTIGGATERMRITSAGKLLSPGGAAFVGTVATGSTLGAIIERGSNANGTFVRYADGTQIATGEVILTFPANSEEADAFDVTFPATFGMSPRPIIHITLGRNTYSQTQGKMLPFSGNISATGYTMRAWNLSAHTASQTRTFQWSAVGNWF
jgi:hypothetical protein